MKVNGATVELTAEDTYTITDIMEDKTVTVEGVKKKSGGGSSGGSGSDGSGSSGSGGSNSATGNPQQPGKPADPVNPLDPLNPTDDNGTGADQKTNPEDDGTGTDQKTKPGDDGTGTDQKTKPGDDDVETNETKRTDEDKAGTTDSVNPTDGDKTETTGQEDTQTVSVTIENGKIVQSGTPVPTGSPAQTEFTTTILKTEKQGAVIVTVVCEDKDYAAGASVADTVAAANAVLTSQQIQQVDNGEIIEIRIDVKDISATIAKQDKEAIETALAQYREAYPQLALGRYIDISMFLKTGAGDWDAVTATEKPIDVIIGVPTKLQEDNRAFYVIRVHEGQTVLLTDTDDNPDTITISTDRFSTYAIAYSQAAGAAKSSKCSLCHICPTFMGICCFIWLAVLTVLVTIVLIIVFRRKDDRKERH